MSSDETELRTAWRRCTPDTRPSARLFSSIVSRHREPHRRYHGLRHVTLVVRHARELAEIEPVADLAAVTMAAFFHDAVYDPHRDDNEAASSRLATTELTALGWAADRTRAVAEMIGATASHRASDADTAVLLDADLAILGAAPAVYQAYVDGVRAEYAHVTPEGWRRGRSAVLEHLVGRESIFSTPTGAQRWEQRAQANLRAELASLRRADEP
jgi:predicted metal-dependent HD superfamily phosphohydrolase